MPSTQELGELALIRLHLDHLSKYEHHAEFCDGVWCEQPELVRRVPPNPTFPKLGAFPFETFEEWMTVLAEDRPYYYENENFYARAKFTELSNAIALEITNATKSACETALMPMDWQVRLVKRWHERKIDVITFNYDTLVEALFGVGGGDQRGAAGRFRLIGPALVPNPNTGQLVYDGPYPPPDQSFRLVKLHGSINWFWDPTSRSAESMVAIDLPALYGVGAVKGWDPNQSAPGKATVLVPPALGKSRFFDNPVIRRAWLIALEAIERADRVIVIGYSMPEGDLGVAAMLMEAARRRVRRKKAPLRVLVVNPDRQVTERLAGLGIGEVVHRNDGQAALRDFTAEYLDGAV